MARRNPPIDAGSYDPSIRHLIAQGQGLFLRGFSLAEVTAHLERNNPHHTAREVSAAAQSAERYFHASGEARRMYGEASGGGWWRNVVAVASHPLNYMFRECAPNCPEVAVTVLYRYTDSRGDQRNGSIIFNVPGDTPVQTMLSRARAGICSNAVLPQRFQNSSRPNRNDDCQVSIKVMTPYRHDLGIDLNVAPYTRQNPNTYR